MSYPSTNSQPANPLADKSWRLRHSAWLLAPILGCGMLSFVGFIYVAIRVQNKKFWIAAAIGSLGSATIWTVLALTGDLEESSDTASKAAESTESMSDLGVGVVMAVWAALLVYAFILNRDYLRWRAGLFESRAWYNQPVGNATAQGTGYAPPTTMHQSQAPGFLGVNQGDYFAPPQQHAPAPPPGPRQQPAPAPQQPAQYAPPASHTNTPPGTEPVDVNTANAQTLTTTLGIDPSLAARVVAIRDSRGGFANLEDLRAAAGLQPHELVKFQNRVTFRHGSPTQAPNAPQAPTKDQPGGRIIDI
jgi:hypothetical protein